MMKFLPVTYESEEFEAQKRKIIEFTTIFSVIIYDFISELGKS